MKPKKFVRLLFALVVVILVPLLVLEGVSIYSYLQFAIMPSAPEQLLDFVEAPQGTELPRKTSQPNGADMTNAYDTDYQPVQLLLARRFPAGTPRQQMEQFMSRRNCRTGGEKVICSFSGVWYPAAAPAYLSPIGFMAACSDSVYVTFSFDAANRLGGIEIVGVTNCI